MFKFDKLYKIIFAYIILVVFTIFQLPSYAPAMRDFSLEITGVFTVLYLFKVNGNKFEYALALILYVVVSTIFNENILEIVLDLLGLFIFIKIYRPHLLIRTVYINVIVLTMAAYLIAPFLMPKETFESIEYIQTITSFNYVKYIITIFPAYLIFEWALNGIIIEYLLNKRS